MSKRDGKGGKKYPPDPHQWYREPRFTVEQIFDSLDLGDPAQTIIFDPSCGAGTILEAARDRGYRTFGSDLIDRPQRPERHLFHKADFLRMRYLPFATEGRRVVVVNNPPYGRVGNVANMAERFVKHALRHLSDEVERFVFILPIGFLAGQDRYFELYSRRKPSHVLICCQRPSMPPGAAVEDMGDAAYQGGMDDYVVIVWTRGGPYRTETIFMKPTVDNRPPEVERRRRSASRATA